MAIVARLLAPEDFGLVAMVTVVTAVLELFATAGLSAASVQRKTITEAQISTLFWEAAHATLTGRGSAADNLAALEDRLRLLQARSGW